MNRVRLAWDFALGAVMIGVLPLAAFLLEAYLCAWSGWLLPLVPGSSILVAIAVLYFVIRWRKTNRKLSIDLLWAEVIGGIILAIVCLVMTALLFALLGD